MCQHQPSCPPADAVDREAAHVVTSHPEQGWSLLCNGIVLFEDTGSLLPNGQSMPPQRPAASRRVSDETGTYHQTPARRPLLARATAN